MTLQASRARAAAQENPAQPYPSAASSRPRRGSQADDRQPSPSRAPARTRVTTRSTRSTGFGEQIERFRARLSVAVGSGEPLDLEARLAIAELATAIGNLLGEAARPPGQAHRQCTSSSQPATAARRRRNARIRRGSSSGRT